MTIFEGFPGRVGTLDVHGSLIIKYQILDHTENKMKITNWLEVCNTLTHLKFLRVKLHDDAIANGIGIDGDD